MERCKILAGSVVAWVAGTTPALAAGPVLELQGSALTREELPQSELPASQLPATQLPRSRLPSTNTPPPPTTALGQPPVPPREAEPKR